MTRNIAIVSPLGISGGVKTTVAKLAEALGMEGMDVRQIVFPSILPPNRISDTCKIASSLFKEMSLCQTLKNFDTVIYMGSIAYLSHFLYFVPKKALVLHGFVQQEWTHWIQKNEQVIGRAFIKARLRYWQSFNSNPKLNELDFLVCRSETNAEANGIRGEHVILPNYVLPKEVEMRRAAFETNQNRKSNDEITLLCYLSTVESPRLLTREQIRQLYFLLTKVTQKRIRFVLIDPLDRNNNDLGSNSFQVLPYVSSIEWTRLVMDSDMYLEACTDEELRNGAIEAGLMGVPIAKVTYSRYFERQDYHENEVLIGNSIFDLATKITEYCNQMDYLRPRYSKRVRDFMTQNRVWNQDKGPLLRKIV